MPTSNWMRDDKLGGLQVLNHGNGSQWNDIFSYLYKNKLLNSSLAEKKQSTMLWQNISDLLETIVVPPNLANWKTEVTTQALYGKYLSNFVYYGWEVMALGFSGDSTKNYNVAALRDAIHNYDLAWTQYRTFGEREQSAASLCRGVYESWPGPVDSPGLDATVDIYRKITTAQ